MIVNSSWVLTHWNPIWGIIVYLVRGLYDLFIGRSNISRELQIQKLKSIGPDLYWISVVVWGILLVKKDSKNIYVSFVGEDIHFRLLTLVFVIILGFILCFLKAKAENRNTIEASSTGGVSSIKETIIRYGLNLPIHIIGVGSLLMVLFLMGDVALGSPPPLNK